MHDLNSELWPNDGESFFRGRTIAPMRQVGPTCVATVLAMLSGASPERFIGAVNTQDPVSWSDALRDWGMKLAYCPTDARKLKHYIEGLVRLDDLFTLSYYSSLDPGCILGDPNPAGWVTGSHIVILHRDRILNPQDGTSRPAEGHPCGEHHTKRIFRVVPCDHIRGL
jgi:hypothetical protein